MLIRGIDRSSRTRIFRGHFILNTIFNSFVLGYMTTLMELWMPHIKWFDEAKNYLHKTALKLSLLSAIGIHIFLAGLALFSWSLRNLSSPISILGGISAMITGMILFIYSIILFVKKDKTIEN